MGDAGAGRLCVAGDQRRLSGELFSDPAEEVKPRSEANEDSSGGPAGRHTGGFTIR